MAKSIQLSDALAYFVEHADLFSECVTKDGKLDTDRMAVLASRGDALEVIAKRTSFSGEVPEPTKANPDPQSAQSVFCDTLFSLAADMVAGVTRSTNSYRITVPTPSGTLTVEVK